MRRIELLRTTAFRWALTAAGVTALSLLLFAALSYHATMGYMTRRLDAEIRANAAAIAQGSGADQVEDVREFLDGDPQLLRVAALMDRDGRLLAGNLPGLAGLPLNRIVEIQVPAIRRPDASGPGPSAAAVAASRSGRPQRLRVLAMHTLGDRLLILGVGAEFVGRVEQIAARTLWLILPPMLLLAVATGYFMSRGAMRRIARVHETSRLIMAGNLTERLPYGGTQDDFDRLSQIVNSMLDEIERLMHEVRGAGENIAHDLRTPLTRLRARMERELEISAPASSHAGTLAAGIDDIDQVLATISAILRIGEIGNGARRAAFQPVDLSEIVQEAVDLYEPMAEEKSMRLSLAAGAVVTVNGDGELLFEAVTNLLDNAVKFCPAGGRIDVSVQSDSRRASVRVCDTGPGIATADLAQVTRRFYRGDRSRHEPGSGLGLSIVAAIARLHEFDLTLDPTHAGCCIQLDCWLHGSQPDAAGGSVSSESGLHPVSSPGTCSTQAEDRISLLRLETASAGCTSTSSAMMLRSFDAAGRQAGSAAPS